jgi:hypothetical protein
MHNFQTNYDKILEVLNELGVKSNYLLQIRKPKLSDKELIAINLTSEYMILDSECQLFRVLPISLKTKIERSVYNRRKRKLFEFQEEVRQKLNARFLEFEDCFIVDSMPLKICKLSRASRSTICKSDFQTSPDKGYCASQSSRFMVINFIQSIL